LTGKLNGSFICWAIAMNENKQPKTKNTFFMIKDLFIELEKLIKVRITLVG
jgi:hypothetical protein